MLSVDPPDEDDSDMEQQGQQPQHTGTPRPGGVSPRPTMEVAPDGAAHHSKHLPDGLPGSGDGVPEHTVPMMNGDDKGVIEIDGEGDAEPSNFDKESPSSVSVSLFFFLCCVNLFPRYIQGGGRGSPTPVYNACTIMKNYTLTFSHSYIHFQFYVYEASG